MIGCSFAFAQTKTISGVVTGSGLPLPGVNVKIKGGSTGAVTDFDGIYKIDANTGDVLVFSSLGFAAQTVTVSGESNIDINLVEDAEVLDNVVVIGYGSVAKKDLTGSVVSVKAEDIEKVQAVSFEQALVAKAPGVRVVTSQGGPGEGFRVKIRGSTSILASSDPLYVIDGFPIDSNGGNNFNSQASGDLGGTQSSPLASIDPSNIQSIEVLKDASATAIYGARGANGVVIVTTKSGKNKNTSFTFETSLGVQKISRQLDLLSPQEYVNVQREANPFTTRPELAFKRFAIFGFRDDKGGNLVLGDNLANDELRSVDWRGLAFREALIKKHALAITGGNDKTWFSARFSYTDQDGVIKNSDFTRYASNFNVSSKINDRLDVGFVTNIGLIKRNGVATATSSGVSAQRSGVLTNLVRAAPVQANTRKLRELAIRLGLDPTALEVDEYGFVEQSPQGGVIRVNPIRQITETTRETTEINGYFNSNIAYKILPNLEAKATFGGSFYFSNGFSFYPGSFGWGRLTNGRAFTSTFRSESFLNENTLKYNVGFGRSKFDALLGFTQQRSRFVNTSSTVTEFEEEAVNLGKLQTGVAEQVNSNGFPEQGTLSFLNRLNYNYDSRYYLTFTGRYDGSSKFGVGDVSSNAKWGFFPSGAFKWTISNENFMSNADFINNLSLRTSYGVTGNQNIPAFITQVENQVELNRGVRLNARIANPNLTWETTAQFDAGLEFGLFNNAVKFEADFYQKSTTDLLYALPVDAATGLVSSTTGSEENRVFTNLGEIRNTGVELSLGVRIIDTKNFKWNADANITFSQNEIRDLGAGGDFIADSNVENRIDQDILFREGERVGSFFGLQTDGIYRYSDFVEFDGLDNVQAARLYRSGGTIAPVSDINIDDTLGDAPASGYTLKPGVVRVQGVQRYRPGVKKYKDQDGDGIVDLDKDRTVLGNNQPDHFGGFSNNFSYKGFDFSVLFNWSYGGEVFNKNLFTNTFGTGTNLYGVVRDRWTPFNTNTNRPSLNSSAVFPLLQSNRSPADDTLIEDASYLRLANISLSYKLPSEMIKSLGLKDFKIFGAVDNAYLWTNYSGYDPDVSVGSPLAAGIDFDAYPRARSFRIGVKGTF